MNCNLRKTTKEEVSFLEWDAKIKKKWQHLINPPLTYKKRTIQEEVNAGGNLYLKDERNSILMELQEEN